MSRSRQLLLAAIGTATVSAVVLMSNPAPRPLTYPGGKRFAFSIVDDTDMTTTAKIRPLYDLLTRYGLRTTKTVWVMPSSDLSLDANQGESLAEEAYRSLVLDLQRRGFEIALHGVRGGSSRRADIVDGLETFKRYLGAYPVMHINHAMNRDNLNWGGNRYSIAPLRWLGSLTMSSTSYGHEPESEYFWGDLAKQHIKYVRQFTYNEVNLLKINQSMPVRRDDTPYVNYWFQTSNGANIEAFDSLLSTENLDRLEREGGVCLVYAHLGAGSFSDGLEVDPRFERRIRDLSSRAGWFVPASEILDFLARQPGWTGQLSLLERLRMETQFTVGRLVAGGS